MGRYLAYDAGTIQTDVGIKTDGPVIVVVPGAAGTAGSQGTTQGTDAKYQEIFYAKGRMCDCSPAPDRLAPADLATALGETMGLSLAGDAYHSRTAYAWIMFYNQKIHDSVSILRVGDDLWNLTTPVYAVDRRYQHKYIAQSDTKRLEDIIRLFFEGGDWYGMVDFTFDEQTFEAEREMERRDRPDYTY